MPDYTYSGFNVHVEDHSKGLNPVGDFRYFLRAALVQSFAWEEIMFTPRQAWTTNLRDIGDFVAKEHPGFGTTVKSMALEDITFGVVLPTQNAIDQGYGRSFVRRALNDSESLALNGYINRALQTALDVPA